MILWFLCDVRDCDASCQYNKKPETHCLGAKQTGRKDAKSKSFLHPDYTVDPGISPDHARVRSWVVTTDRELGPASRTLPRRLYAIVEISIVPGFGGVKRSEDRKYSNENEKQAV